MGTEGHGISRRARLSERAAGPHDLDQSQSPAPRGGAHRWRAMGSTKSRSARRPGAQHGAIRVLCRGIGHRPPDGAGARHRYSAAASGDFQQWDGFTRSDRRRCRGRARRSHAAQRRNLRPRDSRSGTGGVVRRGLRRVRGTAHPGHRTAGIWGAGRHQLDDPQLPWFPARHRRRRAGVSRLGANAALRRPIRLHPAGHRALHGVGPTASSP